VPRGQGEPDARIDDSAVIGEGCAVGPFAVIGSDARVGARSVVGAGAIIGPGVSIGEEALIGPGAVCYDGAQLGNRVMLKAGAVVGGPGFGFVRGPAGHRRLPHPGRCLIGDDVEIGSCTCVDRGNFDDTIIGQGTKIDNLVQVGHKCTWESDASDGHYERAASEAATTVAGGVGIADHAKVGDRAVISAKSVVFGAASIPADAVVGGYPARPHRSFLRAQAALYRLADSADALLALASREAHEPPHGRTPG
jgi:UDP-3-O-[3-hydroxymyristoyl] glucosamine N-acyltransferase